MRPGPPASAESTRRLAPRALSLLLATWASIPGSVAGSSEPRAVPLGEPFKLRVGQSAQIEPEALEIGFEGVPADSRCPRGENCIREGDATVRVWLQKSSGPKESHELRISSRGPERVKVLGYEVSLLRLDPHPVSGKAIERDDYLATFEVTRGSGEKGTVSRLTAVRSIS